VKVIAWPAGGSNPYIGLLYAHLKALGVAVSDFSPLELLRSCGAVWHLHWPERMLNRRSSTAAAARAVAVLALAFLARLRKTRLIWTVHNLQPHEYDHPWIGRWFWPAFIRQLSGFVVLSPRGRQLIEQRHPQLRRIPCFVIPHGHYRGAYPDTVSRAEARGALCLSADAPVAAFVGQIRPYKNVPHLVRVFRQMTGPQARLVIAGQPGDRALRDPLLEAAVTDPRVRLFLEFVPEESVQLYLRAADLVVLPFSEILNSGSALLALSFDRPILVPRKGAMAELEDALGPNWVRTYAGELTQSTLADALAAAHAHPPGRCEALARYDWKPLAERTLEAFQSALRKPGTAQVPVEERARA
jgi:glycosyltransferase involved in cell wall biosynthesis